MSDDLLFFAGGWIFGAYVTPLWMRCVDWLFDRIGS